MPELQTLDRPPAKSKMALFWLVGYWSAREGKRPSDCLYQEDKMSYKAWQQGFSAYKKEKR
ncbi:MAG: hypothetical protein E6R03_07850 [Hyphomicrobiaceae bacterium]|nr:MAG: hypothetical protein E6R03_07850 [Hyphomicrobiaceae bacterium]